jgi:bacteriocin biosynthesis cyclodehydratase domain-containing protein
MILKLDPRFPVLWRNPSSAQLGVDPPLAVLNDVTHGQAAMLSALAVGVTEPGLTLIARGRVAERDALLQSVAPALLGAVKERPAPTIALSGTGPLIEAVVHSLAQSGVLVRVAADAADVADTGPDLAILVHHFVIPPGLHGLWLRRDIPHIPVVFSETGVVVGPIIEPGTGPCLLCIELHRRDADEAWPAIATQLLGRRGNPESALLVLEASATVCRLALERLAADRLTGSAATSIRIDADSGAREVTKWATHPECGCLGIPTSDRRETGWPAAGRRAPAPN